MTTQMKRIVVNFGGGYIPGLNAVVTGAVLAAGELGWEVVGIRDGQDSAFYRESGGGMTLSGGECQLQPDFTAALLEEAHRRGISTGDRNRVQRPVGVR